MDTYTATQIAEGVQPATAAENQRAWSHLIATGKVWELQGVFGRAASDLIERGDIAPDGTILNPAPEDEE